MTPAPTLHTNRLTLHGPQKADLAPLTDMIVNSKRMAVMGGNGTVSDGWHAMMSWIGHWQWHNFGFFIVTDRKSGEAYGRSGLLNHNGWPEPELAYHMFDNGEGKSFAYEAGVAVRQWAGKALGLEPLISIIAPDNARSIRLAKRLGAVAEAATTHKGEDAILFRHISHDSDAALSQVAEVGA